jgi:hypothetical protein
MQRWISSLVVCLVAAGFARADAPATTEVSVSVVKIPGLIEAIKRHKGKVVVVDCWADG